MTLDTEFIKTFAQRVAQDQNIALSGVLAYIGDTLGLWRHLAGLDWVTSEVFAERATVDARYAGEWLCAMAGAGYVDHDADRGAFRLGPERAAVLATDDTSASLVGGFEFLAGSWADADRIGERFTTGKGLAWRERDERLGRGVARFFKPLYTDHLVQDWIPSVEGLHDRLTAGVRVLDLGSGRGLSTFLLARAYPSSTFVGIDPDVHAIEAAKRNTAIDGITNVRFEVGSTVDAPGDSWDVVACLDAFHHFGEPGTAAKQIHRLVAESGHVVLLEPRSHDTIADNIADSGRLYYGPSTLLCVPDAIAQGAHLPLGAQAGAAADVEILTAAGFTDPRVTATTDFNHVIAATA